MKSLVVLIKSEPRTTSLLVAQKFGIAHNELLRKLRNLTVEIPTVRSEAMYAESTVKNDRGKVLPIITMTRDGYMFLVMNISTKKAHKTKLAFIDAFDLLEERVLQLDENKKDPTWPGQRGIGKQARLQETDVIKEFVEYATNQGSQNAGFYYKHITNATYKALQLIQHKKPKIREALNGFELSQLMVAEHVAKRSLRKYMAEGEHYKAIFVLVKQDLEALGSSLMLGAK